MGTISDLSENLKSYFANRFISTSENKFIEDSFWIKNSEVFQIEPLKFLKLCFPQLCFPIHEGIGDSQLYRVATLKGKFPVLEYNSLELDNEDKIELFIYESFAGQVPVMVIPDENDFIKVIQALLYKNYPASLPNSMGASLINGINNWQKIRLLKEKWLTVTNASHLWNQEFRENVLPFPELYKDRIMILSKKNYSGLSNETVGMSEEDWLNVSFHIRLEHECTHLFTLNEFGTASNNLHDELIADYVGITKTIGSFNKEWMLSFMGLENYPTYRSGARLENYINKISLDSEDFCALKNIIKKAIDNINDFDLEVGSLNTHEDLIMRIKALCSLNLLSISSKYGGKLLFNSYENLFNKKKPPLLNGKCTEK